MMMASVLVNQSLLCSSLSPEKTARKRWKQDNFLSLDSTLNSIIKRLETLISAMTPNPWMPDTEEECLEDSEGRCKFSHCTEWNTSIFRKNWANSFPAVASYLTVFPGPLKVRKTTSERSIRACLSWMQLTKTSLRQWWLQCDIKTTTCISISQFYHIYHVGFSKWPKTESWYRVCLSLYMRISQNSRMVCLSVSHSNWSALFEICSNCNKLIYISTKVWATRLALTLCVSLCHRHQEPRYKSFCFSVFVSFLRHFVCLFCDFCKVWLGDGAREF
jgi:hypothetical protein